MRPAGGVVAWWRVNASSESTQPARLLWGRPHDALALVRQAGLVAARHESLTYHVHAHLDIILDGQPITVPAGLGINILDPAVHTGTSSDGSRSYGGIAECRTACISPLHTHHDTGIIHTEAPIRHSFLLGQFFKEWKVRLDGHCIGQFCVPKQKIAVYVMGNLHIGDPERIILSDQEEIAIVIGRPPHTIPSSYFKRVDVHPALVSLGLPAWLPLRPDHEPSEAAPLAETVGAIIAAL